MKKFRTISSILAFVILCYGLLAGVKWYAWQPAIKMEQTAKSMLGRSEADLISVLGEPTHIISAATLDGRTVDYPWKDMNFIPVPDRRVRNKVLLYSKMNMALYIYVDEQGIIEYIVTAWT
jgi:hypothetical protein